MKLQLINELVNIGATPAFVFYKDVLTERAKEIKRSIGNAKLCFAIKANPFLLSALDDDVDNYEVCSPGEFKICCSEKIDMRKVVLSGVNKEYSDIKYAIACGVHTFTVESVNQFFLLQRCACEAGVTIGVLLRLTSGNQFGLDYEDIEKVIEIRHQAPNMEIEGIQYYAGTQKKAAKIREELERVLEMLEEIESRHAFEIRKFEYGPGFSVEYFKRNVSDIDSFNECCPLLNSIAERYDLTLEMGRFLTADCGEYITRVADVKKNNGRQYCIVDGGINHVNYYGQVMGARMPSVKFYSKCEEGFKEVVPTDDCSEDEEKTCVCGSLCTIADVLVRDIAVGEIKEGDIFVFEKVGAYSVTEGIYLFLSRKLPRIYLYESDELLLLRDELESYGINCAKEVK